MSPTALATRGEQKKPIQKRENNVLVEGVLKGILASEKAGNTVCLLVALEIIATLFRYSAYSHLDMDLFPIIYFMFFPRFSNVCFTKRHWNGQNLQDLPPPVRWNRVCVQRLMPEESMPFQ